MPDESGNSAYEMLDFGNGARWERFGGIVVRRPSPAAEGKKTNGSRFPAAPISYFRRGSSRGEWRGETPPKNWWQSFDRLQFHLKLSPHGQVGVFPEQQPNWRFIEQAVRERKIASVINLFAYTGGSTLAAALGGAAVTHVDAAKSVVAWARSNADLSGLSDRPIRWITEDAARFVGREIRRGNTYEGLILDPPSFGRGPKGEVWKFESNLPELLNACRKLAPPGGFRLLVLSCHTAGYDHNRLADLLGETMGATPADIDSRPLFLQDTSARKLASGWCARW